MATTDSPKADEPDTSEQSFLGRLDRAFYRFEGAVVAGALLVMALTYVLKIIDRDMRANTTAFDKFFMKLAGHPVEAEAPPELVASITGFWSPLVLTLSCYLLCVLAFRTRDRLGPDGSRQQATVDAAQRRSWWVKALGATAAIYLSLKIVQWVSPQYLCTLAMLAMMVPALVMTWTTRDWGTLVGVAVGGGWLVWFFLSQAGTDYTWNDKLSLVLLMYVGFFGASMATRDGRHLKIDAIRKAIKGSWLYLYNAIGNTLTALFTTFLLVLAWRYNSDIGITSKVEGLDLGYWLITMPIAISLFVMTLRFAGAAFHEFSAWNRGEVPPDTGPELH